MGRVFPALILALSAMSSNIAGAESSPAPSGPNYFERWHPNTLDQGLHPSDCSIVAFPLNFGEFARIAGSSIPFVQVTIGRTGRIARSVRIVLGYTANGSALSATMDSQSFDLAVTSDTNNGTAATLARTSDIDAFIGAMLQGELLVIAGEDKRGLPRIQTYGLEGVEESIRSVTEQCVFELDPIKRKRMKDRA